MKRLIRVSRVLALCTLLSFFSSTLVNASGLDNKIVQNVSVQTTQNEVPVYSSIEEWEQSGDTSDVVRIQNHNARYQGGYAEYKYVDTKYSYNTRVGYHPDFKNWIYADGYYFSSSRKVSFSPSVSVSWGSTVSVGVSVAKSASSGFFRSANGSRKSRPWVRADITTKRYDMYLYDEFGRLDGIYRKAHNVSTSSNVQIFIDHL